MRRQVYTVTGRIQNINILLSDNIKEGIDFNFIPVDCCCFFVITKQK